MNKKDHIEELIFRNIDKLNNTEPGEGHFDRFEARLNQLHRKRGFPLRTFLKVAAAVVFVLLAVNQAYLYLTPGDHNSVFSVWNKKQVTLASVSPEYREVEFYYTNSISVDLGRWEKLNQEGYVPEDAQEMMNTELEEFEKMYRSLQKDLASNPGDERVINAMLEYYQAKLSLIRMIVGKLEEVKDLKSGEVKNEKLN